MNPPSLEACHLYGILDAAYLAGRDPAGIVSQMIEGGVDLIQIRAKGAPRWKVAELAAAAMQAARPASLPLIVNDHPSVAVEVGAAGVHIGQEDGSVAEARKVLGKGWVGKSTHSLEQARAAQEEGADYIGVGPLFATPTKPDYAPVGLEWIRAVARSLKIPFFCIGGIKLENAQRVLAAGADRIVVVSGILQSTDIVEYCKALKRHLSLRNADPESGR